VTKEEGLKHFPRSDRLLRHGEKRDNEPNTAHLSRASGWLCPTTGILWLPGEHHGYGIRGDKAGEYTEDLAATMLATTLGIPFDSNQAWEEREQQYKASGLIIKTTNVVQSDEGNKDGLWTCVMAAAIFVLNSTPKHEGI